MKRIIVLATILVMIMLITAGCAKQTETSTKTSITYAQLIMPDGTIVEGRCTYLCRHSNGWMEIYIDGVKYLTDKWRVVTWEER